MTEAFPEPTEPIGSRSEVFVRYLDYFRSRVLAAIAALPPSELGASRLPSGWTPLELARHLTFVEQRWLVWGFEGDPMAEPWADQRDGRWFVPEGTRADEVAAALRTQGERTRAVIGRHDLDEVGRPGPRWSGAEPARLERVLMHLVQEYARHAGHLDIVCELAGVPLGE